MAQQGGMMIKPAQIDTLPLLDQTQKNSYKQGLANLWNAYDNSPEGSQARNEARAKIQNASQKIMQTLKNNGRPTSGGGPQQQQQQRPQGGQPNGQQGGGQVPQQGQQAPQQQQQTDAPSLQVRVKAMVQNVNVFPEPTTANQQQFDSYKRQFQQAYGTALLKRESLHAEVQKILAQQAQLQSQGQNLPAEGQSCLQQARNALSDATRVTNNME